ncbi:MAG TPA: four helix bundle suffix domain-containing protein [Verrucomicrobiae bacterium]
MPGPFMPHGGYTKLRSYKVAEAVYDATVVFCRRFFPYDRRMADQMVQAARSGVRNISEGSGAAATSRKSEMKLTNVARASLSDELIGDYKSFLTQNGLRVWPKDSREALAMRARLAQDVAPVQPAPTGKVRLTGLTGLSDFVAKAEPELAANAMLCAVNQAAYLLHQQLKSQGSTFVKEGGFTENLYKTRTAARNAAVTQAAPPCPACGQPMVHRTAKTGPKTGATFWGCSAFPNCKGTRPCDSPTDPTTPTKPN